MISRLAWKEYREGRSIWLALALLGAGSIFVLPVFLDFLGQTDPRQQRGGVIIALVVLSVTYGLVAGSMLLAGEREGQTLTFLDVLSASRRRLWHGKLLVGIVLALTQGLVLAAVYRVGAPEEWRVGHRPDLLWLLPALTLEALAWGLLSSAFSGTVLAGAGGGAALYALSWLLAGAYAATSGRRGTGVYLATRLVVDGLALFASYAVFCHRPTQTRAQGSGLRAQRTAEARQPASSLAPHPWALSPPLWWLVWRQGRGEVVVAGTCLFVLGIGFTSHVSMLWPLSTLLVGIVFGTSVWAREQADFSYRFLTNQRLPPGRVWLVKTVFAAGAALAAVVLGLIGAGIHLWLAHGRQPDASRAQLAALRLDAVLFRDNSPAVALVWLAHGFVAGQLLGMVCRKNIVAVMMSLPLSLMLVGVWLPSLIDGGLPAWQVYVVPALLLLACRLLLWPWATDNLATRRPLLTLAGCGGAAAVVVAGCLIHRVLDVPSAGEPFDVREFTSRSRDRDRLEEGQRVRQALAAFAHRGNTEGAGPLPPPPGMPPVGAPPARPRPRPVERRLGELLSDGARDNVLREGWRAAPPKMHQLIETLSRGDWLAILEAAVKPATAVLFDLRQTPARPALAEVCDSRLPSALALRALQLLEEGKPADSLRHLGILLRLSRVMRNAAPPAVYRTGETTQALALRALELWLERTSRPSLLRQALAELDHHEAELPPADEALKTDYLGAPRRLAETYQELSRVEATEDSTLWYGQLFALAQLTPWERMRTDRLINLAYADAFAGRSDVRARRKGWQGALVSPMWPVVRAGAERGLWQLRLTRLRLALTLFRSEKGRSAGSLSDLAPHYLGEVPTDPFTGSAFAYHVESSRKRLPTLTPDGRREEIEVRPGQGVITSPGPPPSRRRQKATGTLYFAG